MDRHCLHAAAVAALTTVLLALPTSALELRPFLYEEGFEGEAVPIAPWARNGESSVHFIGETEERAASGKRSMKLDVTFESGSYHYWAVPIRVPCAGKLKISARVCVAEGTTGGVGFGTNMVYPPSTHSGCAAIKRLSKPTEGWELHEEDLVARGTAGCDSVLRRYTTHLTGKDAGVYVDRWVIFTYGQPGQRVIVYVDDIRIEGEVPSEEAYEAEIASRIERSREEFRERTQAWRQELVVAQGILSNLPPVPKPLRHHLEVLKADVASAGALVARLTKTGYASQDQTDHINSVIRAAKNAPRALALMTEAIQAGRRFIVTAPERTITNAFATAASLMTQPLSNELRCAACPGEYESLSALVYAISSIKALRVQVSGLTGEQGTIPADAANVYVLKSWYQGAGGIRYSPTKVLKPELLLRDDALVRVDQEAKANYLRSTAEDGTETYLLCSGEKSDELDGVRPVDAKALQPVDMEARDAKTFWINVRVPDGTPAGRYRGSVEFATDTGGATRLPFTVTVRPFDLKPSRLIYSIYYRAKLSPDDRPTITSEWRSEEQYRAEIADLKAHGVVYPSNYQPWRDNLLRRALEIRRELGMPTEQLYNLGQSTGSTSSPAQLRALQEAVKRWIRLGKEFGYRDVYFYGIDEATGDRLKSQQMTWRAVQEAGGKTFVACYKKTFETMGSLLNCAVLAHWPDPTEAEKWHRVGSHAFCYANPQVGVEAPETYRRNFGLVLWKAGFDGAMDYAYQHGFGHVWNDFDSKRYRDHNFTYPTIDGVVSTVQWEGFREGVDDVRYVTTLEHAIENAPQAKAGIAREARQWLDALAPKTADLDAARAGIAQWIERLADR